jgi:hypothetical protein
VTCHAHTRRASAAAGALAALATVTATAGLLAPASPAPGHRPGELDTLRPPCRSELVAQRRQIQARRFRLAAHAGIFVVIRDLLQPAVRSRGVTPCRSPGVSDGPSLAAPWPRLKP